MAHRLADQSAPALCPRGPGPLFTTPGAGVSGHEDAWSPVGIGCTSNGGQQIEGSPPPKHRRSHWARRGGSPLSGTRPLSCAQPAPSPVSPAAPTPGPAAVVLLPEGPPPAGGLSLVPLKPSLGVPRPKEALLLAQLDPCSTLAAECAACRLLGAPCPTPLLPTSQGLFHHELHGTGSDSSAAAPGGPNSQPSVAAESWAWERGAGHRPPSPPAGPPPRPASLPPSVRWGLGEHPSLDPGREGTRRRVSVEGLPAPDTLARAAGPRTPAGSAVVSGPEVLERGGVSVAGRGTAPRSRPAGSRGVGR